MEVQKVVEKLTEEDSYSEHIAVKAELQYNRHQTLREKATQAELQAPKVAVCIRLSAPSEKKKHEE